MATVSEAVLKALAASRPAYTTTEALAESVAAWKGLAHNTGRAQAALICSLAFDLAGVDSHRRRSDAHRDRTRFFR